MPSPAQNARAVVAWLRQKPLCVVSRVSQKVHLKPWLYHLVDDPVCMQWRREMCAACPGLEENVARTVCQVLIDRAHAERADSGAVQAGLESQLRRVFEMQRTHRPLHTVRVPKDAPQMLFLNAPHYDGCLFNPTAALNRGGNGLFLVGLTTYKHPVGVKMMLHANSSADDASQNSVHSRRSQFAREALLTRCASCFDVLHLFNTERHQLMVMPIFSGDLEDYAQAFFSLYDPADASGSSKNGLFGARYVLRHVVRAVADLHDRCKIVHEDIKARNIFLNREQRRFMLGDLGIASVVRSEDQARLRGYTPKFAAPEQFGDRRQRIDSKVDIFGLATTMFHLLTAHCLPVMAYRREHFPDQSALGLFAYDYDLPRMHEVHRRMVFEALDGTSPQRDTRSTVPQISRYLEHFESIHQSVNHFDRPLGVLLRHMVQHDPLMRPRAADIGRFMDEHLAINDACLHQIREVWDTKIPTMSAAAAERLEELSAAMDVILRGGS